tara:strand:+ start:1182 stop:1379 length:198 start_codon:yes stop_codon:yes gene_type:complete
MKRGDLVRWSTKDDVFRESFVVHIGIIVSLQDIGSSRGANVIWLDDLFGPDEAWAPLHSLEIISD